MWNVAQIRKDFPILEEKVYGKPLVYLDNGATAQRPRRVLDKMNEYYLHYNSNVHRGVHYLSNQCTDANEHAREVVRDFIHAAEAPEVIFTRGTTESINLVAYSFGEVFLNEGDEIVVTEMEHHANIVPWQMLCQRKKAVLRVVPFRDDGSLDMEAFTRLLNERTRLVAVAYVSNVLGTVNPVKQIVDAAHRVGAYALIDAAQAVQHIPLDVQALDCDFLAFSGHKIYGPTGVGVLYGKRALLEQMPPWQGGGEMIKEVRFVGTTYNELPFKFEAGTPDFIGVIGLGEALEYVNSLDLSKVAAYEESLMTYAMDEIKKVPGIELYGEAEHKASVISFNLAGIHPFDTGTLLDKMGIAVRTGHLCADPVMQHYCVAGMVRASFAMYNTLEEVDALCAGLKKVERIFKM